MCISLPSNKKGYSCLHITSCQYGRLTPCTYSSIGNRLWHPGRAWLLHSLGNQTPIRVWLITQHGCDSHHPLTGSGLHVPLFGIGCGSPTTHQDVADHLITVGAASALFRVPALLGAFPNCPFQGNLPSSGLAQLPFSGFSKLPFSGYQPSSGLFPTALFRVTCPHQGSPNYPFQDNQPSSGLFQTALIRVTALFRVKCPYQGKQPSLGLHQERCGVKVIYNKGGHHKY